MQNINAHRAALICRAALTVHKTNATLLGFFAGRHQKMAGGIDST